MEIINFLITSIIIILMPGTGVIYTISVGLTTGRRAGIYAATGCTIGIIPHLCASILMFSLLEMISREAFLILKLIGAAYLLYLGFGMLLSKSGLKLGNNMTDGKPSTIIRHAILINLLNPKVTLFFISFFSQYISLNDSNYVAKCLVNGFVFMVLTLVIFIGYGVLAGTAKNLLNSTKVMNLSQKLFGVVFIVFAIQLGMSSI